MGLIRNTAPVVSCALMAIATAFSSQAHSQTGVGTPKAEAVQLEEVIISEEHTSELQSPSVI